MNGFAKIGQTIDRLFFPAAVRESPDLRVLRAFAYIGFAFLTCWLVGFSALELWRYALTQDFAAAHQAWHQITHGDRRKRPVDRVLLAAACGRSDPEAQQVLRRRRAVAGSRFRDARSDTHGSADPRVDCRARRRVLSAR